VRRLVAPLAISKDGAVMAVGLSDEGIRMVDLGDWQGSPEKSSPKGTHNGAAFSPDGRALVVCANENGSSLWDLPSGKELEYSYD